jgi:hypothetical protein
VEVVDDCGEDYGPSSDDCVEAVIGSDGGLTRSIEWIVAYENLKRDERERCATKGLKVFGWCTLLDPLDRKEDKAG